MKNRRYASFDRRCGRDRRRMYNLDYLLNGGKERRKRGDRRSSFDRRSGWMRLSEWYSIHPSMIKYRKLANGNKDE